MLHVTPAWETLHPAFWEGQMPQHSEEPTDPLRSLRGNQLSCGYFINLISVIIYWDSKLKCLPSPVNIIALSLPTTFNQGREDPAYNKGVLAQRWVSNWGFWIRSEVVVLKGRTKWLSKLQKLPSPYQEQNLRIGTESWVKRHEDKQPSYSAEGRAPFTSGGRW